ncbi:MAG: MFS transporter [Anaerolineales bacterium]
MQSVKSIQRTYYLVISLFWLATSLPIALFVLLAQARSLDLFQIGIVMGLYSLTIVLLELPTGGLADTIGRKRVAILAYSFILLSGLVLLGAFSFPVFLVGFMLNGVGRALSSGALDAWFVDALKAAEPEMDLQPAFAKVNTFSLLALGIGTLGGSLIPDLFKNLPPDGTAVFTPLSMPLAIAGVVYILYDCGQRVIPQLLCSIYSDQFFQSGLLCSVTRNDLSAGVIMGGNFLFGMLGNMLITPINKAMGKRYGLVAAIFHGLRGVILIGLALVGNVPLAIAFFWLVYLNMGAVNSLHSTLLNEQIPSEQRSSMLSIESLATYIGGAIGGIFLGYIAEQISISTAWVIAGGTLVLSLFLYLRIEALQQQERKLEPDGKEIPVLEAS